MLFGHYKPTSEFLNQFSKIIIMKNKNLLMIPIWLLYNVESIDEVEFDLGLSNSMKDGYNINNRTNLFNALEWAEQNQDYPQAGARL